MKQTDTNFSRIEITGRQVLLEGWSRVVRIFYRMRRRDGRWEEQDRDMLDRGDGVTVLAYNPGKDTVLLLKQPRVIAVARQMASSETIEACNGLVEAGEEPVDCAVREMEQETGHRVDEIEHAGSVYASPGASLEIVHLFLARYDESTAVSSGGGLAEEGEDIEVMEVPFAVAMEWVENGVICDARTLLTLQHLARRLNR